MTRPTRSEARLLEACARPGCAVCRCLAEDSARHLAALLHEHVTDPEVRAALRASRGLCNWHAAMLQSLPGAAFGAAIVAADLLGRERGRAETLARPGAGRGTRLGALGRWLGRGQTAGPAARRPSHGPPDRRCLVCDGVHAAERRHLEGLVRLAEDPRFADAFTQGDGICAPHLALLVEQEGGGPAVARVVAMAAERWHRLEAALERFIAKHDYRTRTPATEEEARAWRIALEMLAGAPGVFGNARPAPTGPGGRTRPRRGAGATRERAR